MPFPLLTAAPCDGVPTAVMVSGSLSGSVSLASTETTIGAPSFPLAVSPAAVGAWLTVTVIVNVCGALVSMPPFAVPPLSCSHTVTVATPGVAVGEGVNVSVPFAVTFGWTDEQRVVVVADDEVQRLAGFVRRPGADRRRPRAEQLRARRFAHRDVRALDEARRVVHREHGDRTSAVLRLPWPSLIV